MSRQNQARSFKPYQRSVLKTVETWTKLFRLAHGRNPTDEEIYAERDSLEDGFLRTTANIEIPLKVKEDHDAAKPT